MNTPFERMVAMTDPLAVTVDVSGRRWIRCVKCVGSGTILVPVMIRGDVVSHKEGSCPDCNGTGQVEVPT